MGTSLFTPQGSFMTIHSFRDGWVLETHMTGYALGVDAAGLLLHRYWGARLPFTDDYAPVQSTVGWASFNGPSQLLREEFPAYGDYKTVNPCLKVTFADGVRDVVLRFESAQVTGETLTITLKDDHYPVRVLLTYTVHAVTDMIERRATVINDGDSPVSIERLFSAQWHLPYGDQYRLTHVTGRWNDEMHLRRELLVQGIKVLDSRRLTTSHHHNPWFAVDRGAADEDSGEVWFGVLAWSGNWAIQAEVDEFVSTRVNIGINDWDFALRLAAGESFESPATLAGYTRDGFGAASRHLHDHIRDTVIPHGHDLHKVLYNSWEATTFNVDEESQAVLAEIAAGMGIELFVMDDGWFHGRNHDHAGLGDWWADATKFPNGLNPLIARVNALGMAFGLWLEPEMVNPDSDLYRAHPDWVIHFPTRARTEARNQLILNFARPDVQDYLIALLDRLLTDHHIAFIKWDMNRNVSQPGWQTDDHDPREIWVRYVEGLYRVWGTLRARHPQVIWQSCSGGGGRADLAILRHADQIWVSDNTDAAARILIQDGYSHIFPANTMEAWVTDTHAAQLPLRFRFHVSMCGSLGIGGHLLHWSAADRALAAEQIALYKDIRPLVQLGDQYRLRSPQNDGFSAVQYVAKDQSAGVLFAFRTHMAFPAEVPPVILRGLDPTARYQIEGIDAVRSGAAWMADGLRVRLEDFESTVRRITRV